jgi:hypothetical protein
MNTMRLRGGNALRVALVLSAAVAAPAFATQTLTASPAAIGGAAGAVTAGQTVAVNVVYSSTDPIANVTGLGFRVHFDSTRLRFRGFVGPRDELVTEGSASLRTLVGLDTAPRPDTDNLDADTGTDSFAAIAWVDLNGGWPGTSDAQVAIATVLFTIRGAFSGATTVRFSGIATPPGIGFASTTATITGPGALAPGDGDGDGVTDAEEMAAGLDPMDPDDAAEDDDDDGFTNGEEAVAGTQPASPGSVPLLLDVDRNGLVTASRDGRLILRFVSGVTGSDLTNGALGSGATRTDPDAIARYLTFLMSRLDIDADDVVRSSRDARILRRLMAGVDGGDLINGAIASGARRRDLPAIIGFLDSVGLTLP